MKPARRSITGIMCLLVAAIGAAYGLWFNDESGLTMLTSYIIVVIPFTVTGLFVLVAKNKTDVPTSSSAWSRRSEKIFRGFLISLLVLIGIYVGLLAYQFMPFNPQNSMMKITVSEAVSQIRACNVDTISIDEDQEERQILVDFLNSVDGESSKEIKPFSESDKQTIIAAVRKLYETSGCFNQRIIVNRGTEATRSEMISGVDAEKHAAQCLVTHTKQASKNTFQIMAKEQWEDGRSYAGINTNVSIESAEETYDVLTGSREKLFVKTHSEYYRLLEIASQNKCRD